MRNLHALPRVAAATAAALVTITLQAQPHAAALAATQACEPDARAWLERLVGIDSGSANVAGLDAMSAALTPELERLGARAWSACRRRTPNTRPVCSPRGPARAAAACC